MSHAHSLVAAGVLAAFALAAPAPAPAQQFSDSYTFLKAVRDGDAYKARQVLGQPGSTIVNARDRSTGETATHIVVKRRDLPWLGLMVVSGADLNARDSEGNTPLVWAARLGFIDGARLLLQRGAEVDAANDAGETPLIKAVQGRNVPMVRMLIEAGANADLTDNVAGLSARDYAARDRRATAIARLLDEAETAPKRGAMGPR